MDLSNNQKRAKFLEWKSWNDETRAMLLSTGRESTTISRQLIFVCLREFSAESMLKEADSDDPDLAF